MAVPPFSRSPLKDGDIFIASVCPHAYTPFNNVFHYLPGDHLVTALGGDYVILSIAVQFNMSALQKSGDSPGYRRWGAKPVAARCISSGRSSASPTGALRLVKNPQKKQGGLKSCQALPCKEGVPQLSNGMDPRIGEHWFFPGIRFTF